MRTISFFGFISPVTTHFRNGIFFWLATSDPPSLDFLLQIE
jgi:hypothetical protein